MEIYYSLVYTLPGVLSVHKGDPATLTNVSKSQVQYKHLMYNILNGTLLQHPLLRHALQGCLMKHLHSISLKHVYIIQFHMKQ